MSSINNLIPIINSLQDVFLAIGADKAQIDLPQIVVVGSQSAGKSSVLESIVGEEILPRGSGIVTRRPLILQLHQIPAGPVYGEFLHKPGQKYTKMQDICNEIAAETDRETGMTKNISSKPISLKLYSPSVVNLTVVDLPGITRNPIGDQPKDIEFQIKKCVRQYIEKPNAIILAVTAANADLATSDAVQMATDVDPDGSRTVGVLTKVDIMDKGTEHNAIEILNNEVHKLRLGWIAVLNRSQQDIDNRKTIVKHMDDEEKFFRTGPFASVSQRSGVRYLARRLNQVLIGHIQQTLPDLRMRVSTQLERYTKELMSYGISLDTRAEKERMLLGLISQYERDFKGVIDGLSPGASKTELYGGARISYIFHQVLPKMLDTIDPKECLNTDDLRTLIRNSSGTKPTLFIPEGAFELLVCKIVRKLEGPCRHCLQLVKQELIAIAKHIPAPELKRYRRVCNEVVNQAVKLVNDLSNPTGTFITNCITCELNYINTNHPDFIGSADVSRSLEDTIDSFGNAAQNGNLVGQQNEFDVDFSRGPSSNPMSQPQSRPGFPQGPTTGPNGMPINRGPGAPNPMMQNPQNRAGSIPQNGQPPMNRGPSGPMAGGAPGAGPMMQQRRPDPEIRMDVVPDHIRASGPMTEQERLGLEVIPRLLTAYYTVIRKKIQDTVPKSIISFLVKASKDKIQEELVRNLYNGNKIEELLQEDEIIVQKRKACNDLVNMLQKASAILDKLGDIRTVEDTRNL